eukprot:TRINITY_DN93778_c0_g1_i1.p1 TRINITY_DN93778_c0_g1~~TRINITY_DN93778_c0_g1_i1.p1  ORF type:complete len:324 (-),score=31.34 TRINITY_DN93778_c0_g1_i1:26-997(-)
MEITQAQATQPICIPELLNQVDIDEVSRIGASLLRAVDGCELRYDAGMFPEITMEQGRMLQAFPEMRHTFPCLARQVLAAKSRMEGAAALLNSCGVEVRSYGADNAWHVAYLQANRILERLLPGVLRKITSAVMEADRSGGWQLLNKPFHVRCAEYHRQRAPSPAISDTHHFDQDSLITADILLNDSFEGGGFCTLECNGQLASHKFERPGDAIIFVSHKYHCVKPVSRGERRVLVVEFWSGPPRQCPHRCPVLQGSCPLEMTSLSAPCTGRHLHFWCEEAPCEAACKARERDTSEKLRVEQPAIVGVVPLSGAANNSCGYAQ